MHHPSQLLFKRRTCRLKPWSCLLNSRLKERLAWLKPRTIVLVDAIVRRHCDICRCLIRAAHFRQGVCTALIVAPLARHCVDRVHHDAGVDMPVGTDKALDVRLAVKSCFAHDLAAYHRQGISDLIEVVKLVHHTTTVMSTS